MEVIIIAVLAGGRGVGLEPSPTNIGDYFVCNILNMHINGNVSSNLG
jgi:hypothetical protein